MASVLLVRDEVFLSAALGPVVYGMFCQARAWRPGPDAVRQWHEKNALRGIGKFDRARRTEARQYAAQARPGLRRR
jgi:hypothetical protein